MQGIQLDSRIDMARLPRHIAIIMDGNGRWASERGLSHVEGHEAGANSVRAVIETCRKLGIDALSLYAFSTENWRRSKFEVSALFRLLSKYIQQEIDEMDENDIRICFMGRREGLPERALSDMDSCVERTRDNTAMTVNIALNYGGRAEIVDATRRIAAAVQAGELRAEEIDEAAFARYLYQPDLNEVDLLIRTSGELRVSNFMLWQMSYSEIIISDTLWPDFDEGCLCEAIVAYQHRHRRFGGRP
ncbi:MAG: isoprenyl transferase [Candidatus Hydrogenedentes bacterium]|nr:isoprenyl transferase [Candidatus Hydrogenedentota bacterium]